MRTTVVVCGGICAMTCSLEAGAVETRADIESDHIDAADDGGPRSVGVVAHVASIAAGWLGAEVDGACGQAVALTVSGDGRWFSSGTALRATVGATLYVQRFAYHGIYVHPALEWGRGSSSERFRTGDELGVGATVGYEWTWPLGATVRLGAGAAYAKNPLRDVGSLYAIGAVTPRLDGDVGWVF